MRAEESGPGYTRERQARSNDISGREPRLQNVNWHRVSRSFIDVLLLERDGTWLGFRVTPSGMARVARRNIMEGRWMGDAKKHPSARGECRREERRAEEIKNGTSTRLDYVQRDRIVLRIAFLNVVLEVHIEELKDEIELLVCVHYLQQPILRAKRHVKSG